MGSCHVWGPWSRDRWLCRREKLLSELAQQQIRAPSNHRSFPFSHQVSSLQLARGNTAFAVARNFSVLSQKLPVPQPVSRLPSTKCRLRVDGTARALRTAEQGPGESC